MISISEIKKMPIKRTLLLFWLAGLVHGSSAFADVVTLKDGSQVTGTLEVGFYTDVRIRIGDKAQMIPVEKIQSIQFDAPPQTPRGMTLPTGTEISLRTVDTIDSKKADGYKEYTAIVDDPVVVNGVTVI
jgi:hypothetical protein